ncbi:hypothetical protein [Pseudomonas sp. p21]|uniref:hypothetical protein n=1 Tax=Pseudomonas sp. p21 TaxID=1825979 RepID=UPI000A78E99C|nr:hypothetical protein [Pseudomonas sp. p21]
MPLSEFRKTSARWNCLKKVDTLGLFDFCTNIISLDSLEHYHVSNLTSTDTKGAQLNFPDYERHAKALPLIAHEYTHFLDATATVWGMNRLTLMQKAYECPANNEKDFYHMKVFYDHNKRLKFPAYYTTLEKASHTEQPWECGVTSGVEFTADGKPGKRPIAFIRFYNSDGEGITRTPISMVSLLENSAMAEEFEVRFGLVNRLGTEKVVEENLLEKSLVEYLYNPELAEYSVCALLLADRQNCQDLRLALYCSGLISRLVLNATPEVFKAAAKNLDNYLIRYGLERNGPQHKNIKYALKLDNHGMLFYLLTMQLPDNCLAGPERFLAGLAESFVSLGIPIKMYIDSAQQSIKNSEAILKSSKSLHLRLLAQAAALNFDKLARWPNPLTFSDFHLPPSLLGDFSQYQFNISTDNILKDVDLDKLYEDLVAGQLRMEEFGDACL